jgi:hypothetical protein
MRWFRPIGFYLVVATGMAFFTNQAEADLTFTQWASGPPDKRAIYVAGVMETVGVYAEVLGFVGRWSKCLETQKLNFGAVGDGALEYAKKHPFMKDQPAPAVMIAYMNELCGLTILKH